MAAASASRGALAPRIYPAGRAALLLGICAPELAGRKLDIEGRRVAAIGYGRIALLVSFVEPGDYEPERLAGMRADGASFATEARVLETAVERASATARVIPARVLTLFPDTDSLEAAALENGPRWARSLARLGTKRECVVHVYAGPHVAPGPESFVARVADRAVRGGRAPVVRGDEHIVAHATALWRSCSDVAIATRRVPPSPLRGALWTATFLLAEPDVAAFETLVERSSERGAACGVTAHFEGPRLPYSFV